MPFKFLPRFRTAVQRQFRRPVVLFLLVLFWSAVLGWGLAQAQVPAPVGSIPTTPIDTTDQVPARYQLGQELYLKNCATCHVGLPPAVMPTQTWAQLLPDSQHYGVQITPPDQVPLAIIWQYVSTYSRSNNAGEQTPYRLPQSRYFKALHPKVEFAQPANVQSCVTCHPAAAQFNYRSLTPEWENAP
ncbi:MAG TPA: cytochrome C [Coleofasciculaceae cyanobacterium]